ncbi:hypothetical protein MRX96_007098 [Rhipicephalus microplus]
MSLLPRRCLQKLARLMRERQFDSSQTGNGVLARALSRTRGEGLLPGRRLIDKASWMMRGRTTCSVLIKRDDLRQAGSAKVARSRPITQPRSVP